VDESIDVVARGTGRENLAAIHRLGGIAQWSTIEPSLRVQIHVLKRRSLATVFAALAILATPLLLFAHARLIRSTPAANSKLDAPPSSVTLVFSEPPELQFTTIQLVDSGGTAVSLGAISKSPSDASTLTIPVSGQMTRGRYTVIWRTAAADGHASSGRFTFTVLNAAAVAPMAAPTPGASAGPPSGTQAPTAQPSKTGANAPVEVAPVASFSNAVRWAELVSVITMIGAIIFRLVVLPGSNWADALTSEAAERARRLAQAALTLFVITTLMRVTAESMLVPSEVGGRMSAVLTVIRDTRWGHGWAVGAAGAIVVLIGLFVARAAVSGWTIAAIGIVAVCTGDALTGHSGASRHLALAVAADITHYLGAGGWIGGLVAVVLSGLPSLRVIGDSDRPQAGFQLMRAYHGAAVECVALVIISAIVAAWLRLSSFGQLRTTQYGGLLLLKTALVCVVLVFGWYHWRKVVSPPWDADTKFRFQRTATMELIVSALVLAVTAVLVSTPLPE
jgi:putative copper export protein/methionine-rich copper-binding protein CopC